MSNASYPTHQKLFFRTLSAAMIVLLQFNLASPSNAQDVPTPVEGSIKRTLFVPFESLDVLLDGNSNRVMLSKVEYEALLESAQTREIQRAPIDTAITSAEFEGKVFEGISMITGKLTVEALNDGLFEIPLALNGVAVRKAQLDGKPANLWRDGNGEIVLLVSGRGRKQLVLELTVPMATTAARQSMAVQLPTSSASNLRLTVPGNVEVKSGLTVVERTYDENADETKFDLLTTQAPFTLEMSLNNRLLKDEQVVVARSVLFHKLTPDENQLHVTSSLEVIHGAVEQVKFAIPAGYSLSHVATELLSQWEIESNDDGDVLNIQLREATREDIVLNIVASRKKSDVGNWKAPIFQPLNVAGHVAVVGVLADINLQMENIEAQGLVPIDHEFLSSAIPETTLRSQFANPVTIVAAFYAPQSEYAIQAKFASPDPRLIVNSNSRLVVDDEHLELQGGLSLLSAYDSRFGVELELPEAWRFTEVTGYDGQAIDFDRLDSVGNSRIHVRLSQRIDATSPTQVYFKAQSTPANWLDDWTTNQIDFPSVKVTDSTVHIGAIAATIKNDVVLKPLSIEKLQTLGEDDKAKLDFKNESTPLAYRFKTNDYKLVMDLERLTASLNAKTYTFYTVTPTELIVHSELEFDVRQAKTDQFKFNLPLSSPSSILIMGIDNRLKDYFSQENETSRVWTVLLSKAQQGTVKFQVDYRQPLSESQLNEIKLSPVSASNVQFQTAMAAVEGSTELDIEIETEGRTVDIGELSDAVYKPGRYMLGSFSWPSESGEITIRSSRRPIYQLPSAIVQRAEMITSLSPNGQTQTAARFQLVTKQPFLRIELPAASELWSILLNGKPAKPLVDGNVLLISLFGNESTTLCDLQVVFQSSTDSLGLVGKISATAPSLSLHDTADSAGQPVPLIDLRWRLIMPDGYEVASTNSDFQFANPSRHFSFFQRLGNWLNSIGGGVQMTGVGLGGGISTSSEVTESQGNYDSDGSLVPSGEFADAHSGGDSRRAGAGLVESEPTVQPPASNSVPQRGGRAGGETGSETGSEASGKSRSIENSWALSGLRSLNIELTEKGNSVDFQSLGQRITLEATIVDQSRVNWIGAAIALLIGFFGILLTRQSSKTKIAYIFVIILVSCLLPVSGKSYEALQPLSDWALLAAICVAVYFAFAALCSRLGTTANLVAAKMSLLILCAGVCVVFENNANAQQVVNDAEQLLTLIQELQTKSPVSLPEDAIIIPFDANDPDGRVNAERLLLPYEHYIKLMAKAEADSEAATARTPVDYVLSSAKYSVDLTLENDLVIQGELSIELLVDKPLTVALPFIGGALADAQVDGQPAKLQFAPAAAQRVDAQQQMQKQMNQSANHPVEMSNVVLLHLEGKGTKKFEFTVRVGLERQGGWRSLNVRLPVGISRGIEIKAPDNQSTEKTEVRLSADSDRRSIEAEPGQIVESVLSSDGTLSLQWRPSTTAQAIDQSLTAESEALFDVREDGLRLAWHVDLSFRGAERDTFNLTVPEGFLVEKVSGENIRAWDISEKDQSTELKVTLLSPSTDHESFLIELSKRDFAIDDQSKQFSVPFLSVVGAALDRGTLMIRRSPIFELKTTETQAASRVDIDPSRCRINVAEIDAASSPLGILSYQNLRFSTTPFVVGLKANLLPQEIKAETQSILRLGESEAHFETRVNLEIGPRPVYELSLDLPAQVEVDSVTAGKNESWAIEAVDQVQRLHLFLPQGVKGKISVYLYGSFTDYAGGESWSIPSFKVNGAETQSGQIAIQVDPSLKVSTGNLENCESTLLQQLGIWLNPQQSSSSRIALKTTGSEFKATLNFSKIQPRINCESITNVRLTFFAIEETILLDFDIQQAGARQLKFLLPASMGDARITAQLVSEVKREPAPSPNDGMVQVTLDLQDEIMDSYRVVIENDRPLAENDQTVPMCIVQTGETTQRFVTLQNAGRDEIQIQPSSDFQVLNRQLSQYASLSQKLGGVQLTMAYVAKQDIAMPQLSFDTNQRQSVETVNARIEFSKTIMVVDSSGAYRAVQTFQVNNRSEQYLDIELPEDSQLLTVWVEGSPVKPVQWSTANETRRLRIPLVKTPVGDLDYPVQLKYAGHLGDLNSFNQIEFPVINTLNINVQLSQLHLRLPETMQWMSFGGTMTKVDNKGELEHGFLSYKAQQIQELAQQIKVGKGKYDSFSNARAFDSLKKLEKEMDSYQRDNSQGYRFQNDVDINNARTGEANQRAIQLAQQEAVIANNDSGIIVDNRENFKSLLNDQKLRITRNEVTRQGQNWSETVDAERGIGREENDNRADDQGKTAQEGQFDRQWLDRNKLESKPTLLVEPDKAANGVLVNPAYKPQGAGNQGSRGGYQEILKDGSINFANPQDQTANIDMDEFAQQEGEKKSDAIEILEQMNEAVGGARASLEARSQQGTASGPGSGQGRSNESLGLTSLDIELPERGVDFYFKSPRGSTSVTARPVPRRTMMRWTVALIALAVCVIGWIVWKGLTRISNSPTWCFVGLSLLVAVSLFSLGLSVFPVFGAIGLILAAIILVDLIIRILIRKNPLTVQAGQA